MTESGYRAFISYSHRDAAAAQALHRRLEAYRIPRRLVGAEGEHGPIPRRLAPIFRDRDELPAAGDLSEKVRAALAASGSLIILCSPHAAASPWVTREIEAFRELNPGRPVLAAIIAGEPSDCFPAALTRALADGTPTEPLAADLRRSGDGQRLGFLKLVAGLAGVGLDALVQRDAARQIRRVTAVTLIAVAATLLMAVLTIVALDARREADRQRAGAEGLVEFMLTDLRNRLKGVGRLDVLTAANARAFAYYGNQRSLEGLPADSLERRARILHAMGEDDETRGDLSAALTKFREAGRATQSLLARAPDDPERIFAHAQSEFWLGLIDYRQYRTASARAAFQRYKALAERLLAIDPRNPKWLREAAYAEGNICMVALEKPKDLSAALRACAAALARMEQAAARLGDGSLDADLVNRHMWLAGVYGERGDRTREARHLTAQERLLGGLIQRDPRNLDYQDLWLVLQTSMARREIADGLIAVANSRLKVAQARAEAMVRADPANQQWAKHKKNIESVASSVH